MAPPPKQDRFVLFTNLDFVLVDEVMTYTHALLLEELHEGGTRRRLRGFGNEPAWPIFQLDVHSIDYVFWPPHISNLLDTAGRPLDRASGCTIEIAGAPKIRLIASDCDCLIDVRTFEGPIRRVWELLPGLVDRYYQAPYIQRIHTEPAQGSK